MAQRHGRRGRQSQGRAHAWTDGPRQPPPLVSMSPGPEQGVYSNPHMAHAITTLIGCMVDVSTVQGVVYEGILTAISPNMDIALSAVHDKSKVPNRENVTNVKEIRCGDVVKISARTDSGFQTPGSDNIFKTDNEISRSNGPSVEREFEPYTDFNDTNLKALEHEERGWSVEEMFSVNKEKFQVKSNFNEDMPEYTTELKREGDAYRARAERAKVLASEIEGKTKHAFDDTGTEEELFSSVQREHPAAPPPHSTLSTASQSPSHSATTTPTPNSADAPSATKSQVTDTQPNSTIDHQTTNKISNVSGSQGEDPSVQTCDTTVTTTENSNTEAVESSKEGLQVSSTIADKHSVSSQLVKVEEQPAEKSQFKLNPAAKEFRLNPNAKEFKPPGGEVRSFSPATGSSGSPSSASPSHIVTTTSSPSSSYYNSSGGRRSNKPRQPRNTATAGGALFQTMAGSGDYLIPAPVTMVPQAVGGMVRPGPLVSPGGQVLYQAPYQIPGQPLINAYAPHLPQMVSTGGAQNAQQIMLAPMQQQQMMAQQHPALYSAVGLQGATPQGQIVYSPQGTPGGMVYNVAAGVPGAAPGPLVSGATASLQSPQPLIAAGINPSQAQVFAPGSQRVGYPK